MIIGGTNITQSIDLIIANASVFTSDASNPRAQAVAVKGNRIIYVGDNKGAESLRGKATRVIDGQGHTLTAGFIDSHFHLLWGSIWLSSAQLQSVITQDDLKTIMQDFAEKNKNDAWVVGRGIKYNIVSNRHELDTIIADRPMYIGTYDGHTGWANTKGLEMAGLLDKGIKIPEKANIVRDEHGVPTGELREKDAMILVRKLVPEPDANRKRELLKIAIKQINATGVTSVHNMNGDMEELMVYAALEDANEMTLRVYTPYWVKPETKEEDLKQAVAMAKVQGNYARGGSVKFYMDGVWESYTALTIEPYADNPDARVDGMYTPEHFTRMAAACDKLGLQIFVHCCGDGAVRRVLDGYETVQKINGKRDSRHRVEHIEVIHPDDMPRFKQLDVIASMQTSHSPFSMKEGDVWPHRVGEERWKYSFAWRDIKNAGARMAFGSDWIVAPYNPIINMHVAFNREKWHPSDPDQTLTLEDVILGYTRDAAYAEFKENEKGQVRDGYLADLVLFSHDLFNLPHKHIMDAKAVITIVDGKIVFEA